MTGGLVLAAEAAKHLMPLHLVLDAAGAIVSHGPTIAKLLGDKSLIGQSFFAAFDIRQPAGIRSMADLRARQGEKLRLTMNGLARNVSFRGVATQSGPEGMVVNLTFGISVIEAVRSFHLTEADFAHTDLAVEMLYLVEAKSLAMAALKGFALRMQGDRDTAEAQAVTDTLTGLRNRRGLMLALEGLLRSGQSFGLMHMDLDFFKAVNDTMGHAAGDHVLQEVARILNRETRAEDTLARVGGDEFVAVFPGMTEAGRLELTARRIIDELSQPIDFEGQPCRISASIGITMSTQYDEPRPERMQLDADEALYASKRAGRGRAQVFRPQGGDRRRARA